MAFVWTTAVIALLTAGPSAQAADSIPQGNYQADVLGRVELAVERDRLVGFALEGGVCQFPPRQRILEGEMQGQVMVGQLTLCLLPEASCPEKEAVISILAFLNPEDRSLTAYVRPPSGCQAPVVGTGGLVVLQQVPKLEPVRTGPTATTMARPVKRSLEGAKAALQRGNELLARKDWKGAIEAFELSIYHIEGLEGRVSREERLWLSYHGLGTALVMDKQPTRAIELLQRARGMNVGDPTIYYNLACAYAQLQDKKQALHFFELAVSRGLALQGGAQERVLDDLLGSDIEYSTKYTQLTQKAFANFDKLAAGKRQAPGP